MGRGSRYSVHSLRKKLSRKYYKSLVALPAVSSYTFKRYDAADEARFTRRAHEGPSPPTHGQVFLAVGLRIRSSALYVDRRAALFGGTGETVWARIVTTHDDDANEIILRSHGRDLNARELHEVEFYEPFVHVASTGICSDDQDAFKALVLYVFTQCGHADTVKNLRGSSLVSLLKKAVKTVRRRAKIQKDLSSKEMLRGNDFPETKLACAQVPDPVRAYTSVASSRKGRDRKRKQSTTIEPQNLIKHESGGLEHGSAVQDGAGVDSHHVLDGEFSLAKIENSEDEQISLEDVSKAEIGRNKQSLFQRKATKKPDQLTAFCSSASQDGHGLPDKTYKPSFLNRPRGQPSTLQLGYVPNRHIPQTTQLDIQSNQVTEASQRSKSREENSSRLGSGSRYSPIDLTM